MMASTGHSILSRFTNKWRRLLYLQVMIYAIGFAMFAYFLSLNVIIGLIAFIVALVVGSIIIKPWKPNLVRTTRYIDSELNEAEYSSGLLLVPSDDLSNVARLQQYTIAQRLSNESNRITPPNQILLSAIAASVLILFGITYYFLNSTGTMTSDKSPIQENELIQFLPTDTIAEHIQPPRISTQMVTINAPDYTNQKTYSSTSMSIKVIEGSRLTWKIEFDKAIGSATMKSMENSYPMKLTNTSYYRSSTANASGFYSFQFTDLDGNTYTSDIYSIEIIKDRSPKIEINSPDQYTSFTYDESKIVSLESFITDDFGIKDAFIVATVSKGTGESVKFREEILRFDTPIGKGQSQVKATKRIDLDQMNMAPGDELYFYIQALDEKVPQANSSRSDTYFAVIQDTTSYGFGVEGTLGVDRMPDYFRSQRQLIIDTEKLIKERPTLSKKDFNFRSNELGYDQKALRLKYGEFMGLEDEAAGLVSNESLEDFESEESHDHDDDEEDPLAEYSHDHDGDNEHHLVPEEDHDTDQKSKNPLEEFMHDHGDPEAATLFEESLRAKLQRAMGEMWDAELYLRLYEPEKSLPYQYKALKLIQEIKNSARIYVHRIGFDPPPIKEDKRLTGKLEEIQSTRSTDIIEQEASYPNMRQAIARLEQLSSNQQNINQEDMLLFDRAGTELAEIALKHPGKHLKTLQQLKRLTQITNTSDNSYNAVLKGLLTALPDAKIHPMKQKSYTSELNKLFLKALQPDD